MTLQKQTVGIPVLGLNTLADSKSATAGEFDLAENVFLNKAARGGAMLQKRYGGASLSRNKLGGGSIASGTRLATYNEERIMIGSTGLVDDPVTLQSYSPQASTWKEAGIGVGLQQGAAPGFGISAGVVGSSPWSFASPDIAVNAAGTLMCAVWRDTNEGGGLFAEFISVFDAVTGKTLYGLIGSSANPGAAGWIRVIALTSVFMIITGRGDGTIRANTVAYATPQTVSGFTSIAVNMNASCKADIIRNGSNDSILLAYHNTTPATTIQIWNSNQTSGGSTTNAEIPSQAIGWVNWDFSDNNGYLAFVSAATGAKVFTVAQAGPAVSATTTMDATVTAAANVTGFKSTTFSLFYVYIEVRAAATYNCLVRRWPGSGVTTAVYQRSVGLAAACFKVASTGRFYLPLAYDSTLQSGYYVIDGVTSLTYIGAPIIARASYGLGGGLSIAGSIGALSALSTSVMAWATMKLIQSPAGQKIFGINIVKLDFGATSVSGAKRVGDTAHIPGASTRIYDGMLVTELGFYVFPEVPTLVQSTNGGSLLTLLGSYQYAIVYGWPDSHGQWHRSAPSPLATITMTGTNNRVTLTIPTLRLSNKTDANGDTGASQVYVEVYRTVSGGTTFYRVNGVNFLQNTQAADTVSYIDDAADATVAANEILYTTGKVLPRIAPPGSRLMETWRNRLFLAGTENPLELWVSNEYSPGLGGVSFSDALVISMESEGGPITALCEMDDRLVIFKRNAIYALTGNGPTLTGDNQFQQPTRLTATIGSVEQRGVVKTRDGVMFKSTRGIHLLGHNGAIVYVGAGVDTYNSLTVSGACVLEDEEQVRFTTIEGRTLVYHYGFPDEQGVGRWTTFTNQPAVDCIVWNGKFVFLKSDGTVVEETVGTYVDPGSTSINAKVRWAWLSLTQFFGRFKLYGVSILGDFLASFTLTHRLAYDYDTAIAESETKAVTAATLPPLKLSPARRRAVAIQPTLEETSTTQGFTVSGLGLEVGVEPGAAKFGTDKFLT